MDVEAGRGVVLDASRKAERTATHIAVMLRSESAAEIDAFVKGTSAPPGSGCCAALPCAKRPAASHRRNSAGDQKIKACIAKNWLRKRNRSGDVQGTGPDGRIEKTMC